MKEFAQLVEPIPDELSLMAGDAFQCLRNSLDHIVFALSKKGTPTMTANQEDIPQFPIVRDHTKKAIDATHTALSLLSPDARDAVVALTPNPTTQKIDTEPLWLLNKMSNRDKHRQIPLLAVSHTMNLSLNYMMGEASGVTAETS
ncbi:MAG: hypothetical protein ACR2KK_14765 [Acidimicrobiales bacterium]